MPAKAITSLPIAVRVYPQPKDCDNKPKNSRRWRRSETMLVLDTETRVDATQRLTFGSYRVFRHGKCKEEGLFYADDLPETDRATLSGYARTHLSDTPDGHLHLLTRSEFVDRFLTGAYRRRWLIVGFNLPFDLARVAFSASSARGLNTGGFSLGLWSYIDAEGNESDDHYRPRIAIKHLDSKRALISFTARRDPDSANLIPEGSSDGKPEDGYKFRGHFLDLRTLAFALTDRAYSLKAACQAFGVEHSKYEAEIHGLVTAEYIDYNRRDVLATCELAEKLLAEYDRHPINLQVTKAYSPASMGKAYLRAMGITPLRERKGNVTARHLGHAESAFYGGRASAHIRKTIVPVVYTDFLSMYPTVNVLMDLWRCQVADEIRVVDNCRDQIQEMLEHISVDAMFQPLTWKRLNAFVQIVPDGDVLPLRAQYSASSNDWQVGINYVHSQSPDDPNGALWYALPDVVASVLLTGKIPKIRDAFRIEAHGVLSDLKSTSLGGEICVNPAEGDFFKVVIEQRKRLGSRPELSPNDRRRLDKALKVLANSSSYGIYAEMNRKESNKPVNVACYGMDAEPFTTNVAHADVPGEYCFPPIASLITAAAHLMLALLERTVTDLGGTYVMEDTDSMAIVASEKGGLVPCVGGPHVLPKGQPAIAALSWNQVNAISERFAALNPYDRTAVPGSILKIEEDNFDPATKLQREIYCYAISAKRYSLFMVDKRRTPIILRQGNNSKDNHFSEHGLGHLMNPSDLGKNDRKWIAQVWLNLIRAAMGLRTMTLEFSDIPAITRLTLTSPTIMRAFRELNNGKPYSQQVKPFNFFLAAHVSPLGHPEGVDAVHFHLIAPYELDPSKWPTLDWIDQYTGVRYPITTSVGHQDPRAVHVKTYGEAILEYAFHPESKCADAAGNVCSKQTVGLLQRRHVQIDRIRYIGKESNSLEEVDAGLVHSSNDVYTEYIDPRRDEWETKIRPWLKAIPLSRLVQTTGLSRRTLINYRTGGSRPHKNKEHRLITAQATHLTNLGSEITIYGF